MTSKKNFYQKGKELCEICEKNYSGQDTIYLDSNMICLFDKGKLLSVGELKDGKKEGDWYFYKMFPDTLECHQVIRYKEGDSTVKWNRSLINESW
jgi:antitoxin component YwqK of YwqJK toxin-antitoxin module